ncbi:MAG: hypothetical protein MRY83_24740 [Flavobacteriales bacterium]|nr:hypothetical protein [Flavobacteriales bacterium]
MDKRTIIVIASLFTLILGFFLVKYAMNNGPKYDWNELYDKSYEQPYGLELIHNLFQETLGDDNIEYIKRSLDHYFIPDSIHTEGTYLYLGEQIYLDSADISGLLGFVSAGNDAYILTNGFPSELIYELTHEHISVPSYYQPPIDDFESEYDESDYDDIFEFDDAFSEDDSIQMTLDSIITILEKEDSLSDVKQDSSHLIVNGDSVSMDTLEMFLDSLLDFSNYFYQKYTDDYAIYDSIVSIHLNGIQGGVYDFEFRNRKKLAKYSWYGIPQSLFNDTLKQYGFQSLGKLNNKLVNMYSFKYGTGNLFFMSNPITLTNYNVIKDQGFNFINEFFSKTDIKTLYWDIENSRPDFNWDFGNFGDKSYSPLKFLFSHKSFKAAWYLSLVLILLFLIFRSKRVQKIIPVLPEVKNTSIEYTKAIGTLYFTTGNKNIISEEIFGLFVTYLRRKYQFNYTANPDNKYECMDKIVLLSGVPEKNVKDIFDAIFKIRYNPNADINDVSKLHRAIEYFYQNCK